MGMKVLIAKKLVFHIDKLPDVLAVSNVKMKLINGEDIPNAIIYEKVNFSQLS